MGVLSKLFSKTDEKVNAAVDRSISASVDLSNAANRLEAVIQKVIDKNSELTGRRRRDRKSLI